MQLEGEGLQVERVSNAEDGLALARQKKFALVTLDILLPGMDGWDFLAKIKESPETENLPVVIISIVADTNRGLSLGASAILQKPITQQMLNDALDVLGLRLERSEKLNVHGVSMMIRARWKLSPLSASVRLQCHPHLRRQGWCLDGIAAAA